MLSTAGLLHADLGPVIGPDVATQGSWNGKFGQDGYLIANGASSSPSYGSAAVVGAATFTWAGLTTDIRALQSGPGASTRLASTYYANNFNVVVNVNDGQFHPVSLYFLDWDTTSRAQTVTVLDAASNTVLDTVNITAFNGGKYHSWNVRGSVRINISATGPGSAVLSGVFFGINASAPPPSGGGSTTFANPIGFDTTTKGSWQGTYGSDGYYVVNGMTKAPFYGSATPTGHATFTWAYATNDPRALQNTDVILGPIRSASTYYGTNYNINVTLNDSNSHQISLYFLDWDRGSQPQTVRVYNTATGELLNTQTISDFGEGKYFSWNVKGNVRFNITSNSYTFALVSGIFFGTGGSPTPQPPVTTPSGSAATWVGQDAITQGTWTGKYGAFGYLMANGPTVNPSYASANVTLNPYNFTWAVNTGDVRALQLSPGNNNRIAATWGTTKLEYFHVNVNITDGQAHNVSLYLLDWDSFTRPETISVLDAATGQVLDSKTFDGYHNGLWVTWNVRGNVIFRVTPIGEHYAAASGVFFN
jgi:hypothetical protein